MARQAGLYLFEGTVGDATGYKMNGKYYLKTKSSISRRRIREHDRFSNTRRNAKWFGEAVKLAQKVYYELDRSERGQHSVWYPMRNRAQELVRKGMPAEEIICLLRKEFIVAKKEQKNVTTSNYDLRFTNYDLLFSEKSASSNRNNELPEEILLGRIINPGVELSLADQLAVSTAFIKTILRPKMERIESFYVKAGRPRLRR